MPLPSSASRCRAITVDEFQDVNLLQQALLDCWLGPRDELCVVGDDYQAIYGFTGASPRYLLALRERFAARTVVTLEENYRSSPQVLELANRLTPRLGGAPKTLRAVRPERPRAGGAARSRRATRRRASWSSGSGLCRRGRPLRRDGDPLPPQRTLRAVGGGACRRRDPVPGAWRAVPCSSGGAAGCAACSAARSRPMLADDVRRAAIEEGWAQGEELERVGEYEATRQHDLGRLVALARQLEDGDADGGRILRRARRALRRGLRRLRACTCSPTTARRASSSKRCSCRRSRSASCPSARRRPMRPSPRSDVCSTSAITRAKRHLAADLERRRQAEPLPGRARCRGCAGAAARARRSPPRTCRRRSPLCASGG